MANAGRIEDTAQSAVKSVPKVVGKHAARLAMECGAPNTKSLLGKKLHSAVLSSANSEGDGAVLAGLAQDGLGVPLADKKPSLILDGTSTWIGPMWAQIDDNLILRHAPAKTEFTSGAEVVLVLRMLPMVMEELALVPELARRGPLIVNPRTPAR